MQRYFLWLTFSLALLVSAGHSWATLILDFTGGVATSPDGSGTHTGGWEFNVTSTIRVDGLGFWDEGGNGLAGDHEAGLWNSDGSVLLAYTVITNASAAIGSASPAGRWLFNDISPMDLPPGNYVLGASFIERSDQAREETAASTIPEITFVTQRAHTNASSLAFPEPSGGTPYGIFGSNLRLAAVPEPSTVVLFSTALFGFAAGRSRRRRV